MFFRQFSSHLTIDVNFIRNLISAVGDHTFRASFSLRFCSLFSEIVETRCGMELTQFPLCVGPILHSVYYYGSDLPEVTMYSVEGFSWNIV